MLADRTETQNYCGETLAEGISALSGIFVVSVAPSLFCLEKLRWKKKMTQWLLGVILYMLS